ncbi:MAG TPA: hypothetical protein EYH34_14140 [Planctomycetes bacterium]|nr:hypothetical protein [Planctomycetota bacterium]
MNERRLAWLQRDSSTRYGDRGVMAIDNVLIDHEGRLIQDVGRFWDHAEGRHEMAHDYLMANDICTSGKHDPLEFRQERREKSRHLGIHREMNRSPIRWCRRRRCLTNLRSGPPRRRAREMAS